MDAETTVVVVAGGLGVIALLIVIGYCGNQNKVRSKVLVYTKAVESLLRIVI